MNLHGSPLFQQIAQRAADFIVSPLVHDHTCHHREKQAPSSSSHVHRRHGDHGQQMEMLQQEEEEEKPECEPHKLFDEWLRASSNRIGSNQSIVQMIDIDSSASLFQLKHGIPSLLIEMTDEQVLKNFALLAEKNTKSELRLDSRSMLIARMVFR